MSCGDNKKSSNYKKLDDKADIMSIRLKKQKRWKNNGGSEINVEQLNIPEPIKGDESDYCRENFIANYPGHKMMKENI